MEFEFKQLDCHDVDLMNQLLDCFGTAFREESIYGDRRPDSEYMKTQLRGDSFIAVVALKNNDVIGGLAAYDLKKFEQERSEIYIYDLAVAIDYRRQGVATRLIETLKPIAKNRGAGVIFVQADYIDSPAIELYSKLGVREDVLHFDIPVSQQGQRK